MRYVIKQYRFSYHLYRIIKGTRMLKRAAATATGKKEKAIE